MSGIFDALPVSEFSLGVEEVCAQYAIPANNLELQSKAFVDSTLIRLVRKVAYLPGDDALHIPQIVQTEIKVPATWWDAFREEHFGFLLRWFPIKYIILQEQRVLQYDQTYEARAYVPDLSIPNTRDRVFRWFRLD